MLITAAQSSSKAMDGDDEATGGMLPDADGDGSGVGARVAEGEGEGDMVSIGVVTRSGCRSVVNATAVTTTATRAAAATPATMRDRRARAARRRPTPVTTLSRSSACSRGVSSSFRSTMPPVPPSRPGADGDAECIRRLTLRVALEHHEDHDAALHARELGERGEHAALIRRHGGIDGRRRGRPCQQRAVAPARSLHVPGGVDDGGQQPGQRRAVDEAHGGLLPPRLEEGDRHGILGVLPIGEQTTRLTEETGLVEIEEVAHRRIVTGAQPPPCVRIVIAHTV